VLTAWGVKHDAGIRAEQDPTYTVPLSGPSLGFPEPEFDHPRWRNNLTSQEISRYNSIDEVLQGLQPGYYILAGRPSAGKTSFGNNIALNLAEAGHHVACVTIDLPQRRSLGRSICNLAGVSLQKILKGYVRGDQWQKVLDKAVLLKILPIHILENQSGLYEVAAWARLMKAQYDIKLLTIDYIQQLRGKLRSNSLDDRMTEVSEVIKSLAAELGIPILAYAQFNRQSEIDSRPPTLADLRGSGTFEQDAMVAMLLYKFPNYPYDTNPLSEWSEKHVRPVVVDIAKSQDGETDKVPFWFRGGYFKFQPAPPRFGLSKEDYDACLNPKKK
jgi:replicative DNA helicase